ncbi:uncharacterized protein METZ01_LOCUS214984, partial [marine metagenome]
MPTVAEKFISDNSAKVHDRIRISTDTRTYEGFLLPSHNFSGEDIVVLKLDNGYNIGVSVEGAELTILSNAKKNKAEFPKKKKDKRLKDISVLATGGTIASFVDYKTGAVSPAITAEQLVNSV